MRHTICALLVTFSAGCSLYRGGDKVVKLHPDDECASVVAPKSGTYAIAYRDVHSGDFFPADYDRHKVKQGQSVGFRKDKDGKVIAFAGERQRPLGRMPLGTQYVCWYRLSDATVAARKFGDGVRDTAAATAKVTATAGLVGGLWLGEGALESALEDEDCDEDGDSPGDYADKRKEQRDKEHRSKYRNRD
jgi:hypothetical protein